MKVNALDLTTNFSGTLMALVNGIGAITGIFVPYIAGVLTPNVSANNTYKKNALSVWKEESKIWNLNVRQRGDP